MSEDILQYLSKPRTIPEICKHFAIDNEFKVLRMIADLESMGKVTLSGFDRIYREDGGAIYLAQYEAVT